MKGFHLFLWLQAISLLVVAMSWNASAELVAPGPVQPWEHIDGLPAELQGQFPIHMPNYEGVGQLLLLSDEWVVVAFSNLDEVYAKVNRLSDGAFFEAIDRFAACQKAGKEDWKAYHSRTDLLQTHVAAARQAVGEFELDKPEAYSITGSAPAYREPQAPVQVARTTVGLGDITADQAKADMHGMGGIYYAQYCYLKLPTRLVQGQTCTITVQGKRKVTFVYDETRTVSRAIKVNQVGYLPDAPTKFAYMGAYLWDAGPLNLDHAKTFQVINAATGEIALTGKPVLRDDASRADTTKDQADPAKRPLLTGERVYELDFTALKEEGVFFISVPGVGRSWPFRHSPDVYGEVFYAAGRSFYHQRCRIPLQAPYTQWPRIQCHTAPIYESDYLPFCAGANFDVPRGWDIFDIYGATIKSPQRPIPPEPKVDVFGEAVAPDFPKTENVDGGWHDAADWDRNIRHYACIFDLLYAYQLAPKHFSDGQWNIPESGNGVPDILDEAEYGLRVWKNSQTEAGAVSGFIETWTHPHIDDPNVDYAFSRRTRWSTLLYAAGAAHYAHLVKPFDAKRSAEYAASAKKAYDWGSAPANSLGKVTIEARRSRGKGERYTHSWEEKETMISPFLIQAKMRLAILTGDDSYLNGIAELEPDVLKPGDYPNTWRDFSVWLMADIPLSFADKLPPELVAKWRSIFVKAADHFVAMTETMPYRQSFYRDRDFWLSWGTTDMTIYNRVIFIANALEPKPAYRKVALQNCDFMLGANPLGMSWTTGLGYSYPVDIQHENSTTDGVLDPVPGITIFGITERMYSQLRYTVWRAPKKAGVNPKQEDAYVDMVSETAMQVPVWRCWSNHPSLNVPQNEFTICTTNTSTMFSAAMLLPDGWKPSDKLKQRGPRDDAFLFGYYHLP